MKTFIVVCAFAIATSLGYQGPEHHPVLTRDGVPVDTPEVQAAKQRHLAALSAADSGYQGNPVDLVGRYSGPQYVPQITNQGVPIDTPEVQAARAKHLAALNARGNFAYVAPTYGAAYVPVINNLGVPVDTPEVQAAKARHLSALAAANYGPAENYDASWDSGAYDNGLYNPVAYSSPVVVRNGVPLDTPEVQAAKERHFAAVRKAAAQSHGYNNYY